MAKKKVEAVTDESLAAQDQVTTPTMPEELAQDAPALIAEEQAPEVVTPAVTETATAQEAPAEEFAFDIEKAKKRQKTGRIVRSIFVYIFLTFCAIMAFLPFYWMVISSFKTEAEYRLNVPTFFPHTWAPKNYAIVVNSVSTTNGSFARLLINTLVVGLLSTVIGVIVTIITAYALARMNFKGKNILFAIMLATMMIPGEMFTISNFVVVAKFGWRDSYTVMILPFLVSVYYIYLLRNNFMQIPNSLYQAAKVDGLSDMGYLIKVMVPLTGPTLISITLLKFIGTWNSYIWPKLVQTDPNWRMITNWVTGGFYDSEGIVNATMTNEPLTSLKMAAVCMVSLPLFVLFIFCRKYIMHGVSKSGTKG